MAPSTASSSTLRVPVWVRCADVPRRDGGGALTTWRPSYRCSATLLTRALGLVRPGGVVVYATCSPHLAETREVLAAVTDGRAT